MPGYAHFPYRSFLKAVEPAYVIQYLKRFSDLDIPQPFEPTEKSVREIIENCPNKNLQNKILGDWTEMRKMASLNFVPIIIDIVNRQNLPISHLLHPLSILLKIYLSHPKVYEIIQDLYLIYNSSKVQTFWIKSDHFTITQSAQRQFEAENRAYFEKQGKGHEQIVHWYNEQDELLILIKHGSYERVETCWQEDNKTTDLLFRPVRQDTLRYLLKEHRLIIGARWPNDQQHYFDLFNKLFMGGQMLDLHDSSHWEYTLEPIRQGAFNFSGEGRIQRVVLRRAALLYYSFGKQNRITLSGPGILETIDKEMKNGLANFELKEVSLEFYIRLNSKTRRVSFSINPPNKTDLNGKPFESIIDDYLKKYGVKLH